MAIVRKEKFIFVETNENHNKVWYIEEHDNNSIRTEWGRVGNNMAESTKSFSDQYTTSKEYDKLVKSKLKKGYTKLKTIDSADSVAKIGLESIALNDISYDKNSSLITNMIKDFCKSNIHNIVSNTNISFNADSNIFTTPVGVVTLEAVEEARILLKDISNFVEKKDFDNIDFTKSVEKYCSLIPQKISKKFNPKEIFSNLDKVNNQGDVLNSLTDSIKTINELNKNPQNREKIFNTSLKLVEDQKTIDYITHLFKSTHNNMHSCRNLKIKNIYEISIDVMNKHYEETESEWKVKGKDLNHMTLWHGTKKHNIISIMKNGLVIPPKNASYTTGAMFGVGLYFSDQSTKSLNYSYGYWDGTRDSNCYMFLADVLMGKAYIPSRASGYKPDGYDSIFAKAHKSGVMNNEMIVMPCQAKLKYLIEFGN